MSGGDQDVVSEPHHESTDDNQSTPDISTRESIMDAAIKILSREGMKALTTRAIAREAGVNQALINYHYRTKSNLLLELSQALETEKYSRQSSMYAEAGVPLSFKFRQAIDFYRQDLDDGYIRLNQEIRYLSITDRAIASAFNERTERWAAMLEEVAKAYFPELEIDLPPSYVADAVCSLWYGMDQRLIIRTPGSHDEIFEILEYIAEWLEERERAYGLYRDQNGT
jgi:AcrR family transcriptional regulator